MRARWIWRGRSDRQKGRRGELHESELTLLGNVKDLYPRGDVGAYGASWSLQFWPLWAAGSRW